MAEESWFDEGNKRESLATGLYFFREAARAYLQLKDSGDTEPQQSQKTEDDILGRMFGRLPYLVEALVPEQKDVALQEIARPVVQMLMDCGHQEFASEKWFVSHINSAARKEMVEAVKKGQVYLKGKADIKKDIVALTQGGEQKVVATEENPEIQMLRNEIIALIERDKKLSVDEQEAMKAVLQDTVAITYQCNKSKVTYGFGDFKVVGVLSIAGNQLYNRDGTPKWSSCGYLSREFVLQLKTKGKFITSKGQGAKSAKAASDKSDKKLKSLQQKFLLQEELIAKNQERQQICFNQVIASLDAQFLLSEMLNPQGVLAETMSQYGLKSAWQQARQQVIKKVFACAPVWQAYMDRPDASKSRQQSRFDYEVELALQRNEGQESIAKLGQGFFDKFVAFSRDENGAFDVTKIGDDLIRDIFNQQAFKVSANLPMSLRKEALMQEIFRRALTRKGNIAFDEDKYQIMNRLLMLDGMKIELKEISIQGKYQTASAREFSEPILADMQQCGVVENRHKTEAFLYHLGAYRQQHPKENLKGLTMDSSFVPLYREFVEAIYGRADTSATLNPSYREKWVQFVSDKHNLQQADNMYQMMQEMVVPGMDVDKIMEKLARGKSLNAQHTLVQQSKHHVLYRRFAGFFGQDLDRLKSLFNARENIVDTITLHPVLDDVHKNREHRFDMGEEYLYKRPDGKIVFGAYGSGNNGNALLMPVVCVKNKQGGYEPLMQENMLLMTSKGVVLEPHIGGQSAQTRSLNTMLGSRTSKN